VAPVLPATEGAEFIAEAKPDTQVEDVTQESIRDITDPIKSTRLLERELPYQNGFPDVAENRNSTSKRSQKYDAEVCLSMVH